jgi:predicted ATP-grasp superfamily ATP-dependent carboligase
MEKIQAHKQLHIGFIDPKSPPKNLHLINILDKVVEYKISVAFLYTKNEQAEKEIRKTISFIMTLKRLNT